jgi:hypothetical protein
MGKCEGKASDSSSHTTELALTIISPLHPTSYPPHRHPRASGDPALIRNQSLQVSWAPAFAGVTVLWEVC